MTGRLTAAAVTAALAACAFAGAPGGAAHAATAGLGVSVAFDADGQPSLSASATDGSSPAITWSACPDGGACAPTGHTGATYAPGETPSGTVFQANATVGGQASSARSPVWGGRITATAPATLTGTPAVGQTVTPHPATWKGGWPDDTSGVDVQVCDTADGTGCVNTEPFCGGPPRGRALTLDASDAGKYVQAVDYRLRGDLAYPQICQVGGNGGPGRTAAQTVSLSPLRGPITGSSGGGGGTTPPPVTPVGPGGSKTLLLGTPQIGTGARFRVTCESACTIDGHLTLSAATARAHHLPRRAATVRTKRSAAGATTLTLRLSARARQALRKAHRVRVAFVVQITFPAFPSSVHRASGPLTLVR